jgi:argininosuccinate lyase
MPAPKKPAKPARPASKPTIKQAETPAPKAEAQRGLVHGRFEGGVHPALDAINRSLPVDRRLWREDLAGSKAHAEMLGAAGILPAEAVARILEGLGTIEQEWAEGRFVEQPGDEDVHMAVERRLIELIGPDGARLHTARSRNDQVATDLKLYLRGAAQRTQAGVRGVQKALVLLAQRDGEALMPFYTHLQRAQPVLLGHALLAYVEMFEQDRLGLDAVPRECPLGAGAGAGTTFPVDRARTARALGFAAPSPNSLEAVSSRRDATSFVGALALLATTLSRLGADLVLWTTREFGFARLGDAVSTGSSIMPQKRNPDGAELLRARAARVAAAHHALLEIQRGLPLGYSKDLQEDKVLVFEAEDHLATMLGVAQAMLGDITFDAARMRAAVDDPSGYLLATEAADYLAKKGVPFREAHGVVGRLVREAERLGVALEALPLEAFQAAHPAFDDGIRHALTPEAAVQARGALGGTSPANVRREIARWERLLSR